MQALIPFVVALSLASASKLSLVPYAYLANPISVYNQFINTKTGEHAYSYAGGPSAKQEIKDANGVVRGSYNYIDANSVLQSVYYVADDDGFRVLATDLPSDGHLNTEAGHIILARSTKEGAQATSSRRKRSAVEPPMEQKLETPPVEESKSESSSQMEMTTPLPPKFETIIPYAISHQRHIQVHRNGQLEIPELKQILLQTPVVPITNQGIGLQSLIPTYPTYRIPLYKDTGIGGSISPNIVITNGRLIFEHVPEAWLERGPPASSLIASISSYDIGQFHEHSKIQESLSKTEKLEMAPAKEEMNSASNNPSLSSGEASSSMSQEKEVNTIIAEKPIDLLKKTKEPFLAISSSGISQIHPAPHPISDIHIPPIVISSPKIISLHPGQNQ